MIYGIIIFTITVCLVVLSLLSLKKQEKCKRFAIINVVLFLCGTILLAASYTIGIIQIQKFEADKELFSWLMDYYSLYYDLSIIPFIVLFLINLISAVVSYFDKKPLTLGFKYIREIVSVLSSLLLLILPYYGMFTQNDSVPMYIYMMVSGIGMALIIRLSNAITLLAVKKHIARNFK